MKGMKGIGIIRNLRIPLIVVQGSRAFLRI
jgi:hypothetical protein